MFLLKNNTIKYTFYDKLEGENMKEVIGFIVTILLCFALLTGLCLWLGNVECNIKTRDMNVPHKYGLISECMVQQNNLWIPIENWQITK